MSVEVTRLASGLSVVTDRMPHLESASLGVWVGAGSRDEQPDEHGISHLLEHMAFKGTKRRSARQIAEEIEAVGGDLNAAHQRRIDRLLLPACSRPTCRWRSTCSPTSCPSRPSIRKNCSASRTSSCRRSAPPKTRPTIWCSTACRRSRFPGQPIGRSILGTPETVRSFTPARLRAYLARNYRGPDMLVAAAGAVEHKPIVAEAEKRFASFIGPAAPQPEPAHFGGGTQVETRDLEQVHIALASKACR